MATAVKGNTDRVEEVTRARSVPEIA